MSNQIRIGEDIYTITGLVTKSWFSVFVLITMTAILFACIKYIVN